MKPLNDSQIKKVIEETFKEELQFHPNDYLLKQWTIYTKKQGWNYSENTLKNNLREAITLMKKFYSDKDSFSPKGYETSLKAKDKGLDKITLDMSNINTYILEDLVDIIAKGWDPFEIEWLLTGQEPKGYVEIFYEDDETAEYGERARKEIINELQKEYNFHPLDIGEVLIEFSEEIENFKNLDKIIIKTCDKTILNEAVLIYCKETDWPEIKEKIKNYVFQKLKKYYITKRNK